MMGRQLMANISREKIKWISEPDNGVYEAMNKSLAKEKDVVVILNTDGWLYRDSAKTIESHIDITKNNGTAPWLALSMGFPALVYDVGGLQEQVQHGETGWVLSAQTSGEELGRFLLTLYRKPEMLYNMRDTLRLRHAELTDWKGMAEKLLHDVETRLCASV